MGLSATGAALQGPDVLVLVAYFLCIPAFGAWVGRGTKNLEDFFLAGRKFPGWLVGFSCVATVVGSYSFVKYSSAGYRYGFASSQTYFNDWIWMPLFLFGWLPILYAAGLLSVPDYFRRRFDPAVATAAAGVLLLYLVGYIGINLFTIGRALEALLGVDLFWMAAAVTVLCLAYEFTGGQTSVIWTDLVQAVLLLAAGLYLALRGLAAVGGLDGWLAAVPDGFLKPLPAFSESARFNFVGIFWQDALAGGVVFYFMNQGMLLRFLSARSLAHSRRAALWVLFALMPLAAVAVSGAGWIGAAMVSRGDLPESVAADEIFVRVAEQLAGPGLFGLVMAALLAALMSTADTLINASSSIVVHDLWRPQGEMRRRLRAARVASLAAAAAGLALVPLYRQFGSIYEAHGAFTASITPPMAVTLLLAILWPRFPARAAWITLVGGTALMFLSLKIPVLVAPFAHGVPAEGGYKYIRAAYGIGVSLALALASAPFFPAQPRAALDGLTIWTFRARACRPGRARVARWTAETVEKGRPAEARLSAALAGKLGVEPGRLVFIEPWARVSTGRRGRRVTVTSIVEAETELRLHWPAGDAPGWTEGALAVESVEGVEP